jgi:hypothetical protein
MHEDKYVYKRRSVLKMDKQTAVLSVMFVLVGMMFLVPAITEQAHAKISARAISSVGPFSRVEARMSAGSIVHPPLPGHSTMTWVTTGSGPFGGGDERGYVLADVGVGPAPFHRSPVKFDFFNPAKGTNTCGVEPEHTPYFDAKCSIEQGTNADAHYEVTPPLIPTLPGARLPLVPPLFGPDANGDEGDNSGDTP